MKINTPTMENNLKGFGVAAFGVLRRIPTTNFGGSRNCTVK